MRSFMRELDRGRHRFAFLRFAVSAIAGCALTLAQQNTSQPSSAKAQESANKEADDVSQRPFLWKIERDPPAYLFGTIHLADDRIMNIPPVVEAAFESADVLLTEIPMDMAGMVQEMMPRMMLPEGQTLKTILPAPLYERMDKYLVARGQSMAAMNRYKVWAAGMQIALIDLVKEVGMAQGLDMYLANEAKLLEKEAGGLETIGEQLAAMEGLTQEEQIKSIEKAMGFLEECEKKGRKLGREMLDSYFEGDEKRLTKIMDETMDPSDPIDAKSVDLLITQRDKRMAERIDEKLKANPKRVYMFAVGAYHLIGPKVNVITHLEKSGWKIRRLTPRDAGEVSANREKRK